MTSNGKMTIATQTPLHSGFDISNGVSIMSVSFSHELVDKILSSIHFPPRPSILTLLMEQRRKPDPDLMSIAHIIGKDVVLSAAVLKTVNSPFFGLRRKLDSIEQAVMAMGSNNVINIVAGLALRNLNHWQHRIKV